MTINWGYKIQLQSMRILSNSDLVVRIGNMWAGRYAVGL